MSYPPPSSIRANIGESLKRGKYVKVTIGRATNFCKKCGFVDRNSDYITLIHMTKRYDVTIYISKEMVA